VLERYDIVRRFVERSIDVLLHFQRLLELTSTVLGAYLAATVAEMVASGGESRQQATPPARCGISTQIAHYPLRLVAGLTSAVKSISRVSASPFNRLRPRCPRLYLPG